MADDPPRRSSVEEMPHESESGGAGGSPTHAPSPPRAAHALPPADTFHQQIMQSQSPRKNHIAERAKQSLENSFLIQLKKQQQLQQEILLQHFQQQRQQLAEQHEQQLRHHLKLWEQQKALEEAALREAREAREARERHERDAVRKRDKHDHSANASTQVKQKLQEFLKKKQAAACANGTVPGSPYRNWGIVKSSSGESITSPPAPAHPYRLAAPPLPALHPPSVDFPLRKTASEPNMLKVRLKARVIERRASPLARRPLKCRLKRNMEGGSPRGSPPGGASAPIREEEEGGARPELLFSSPSLPNISLGRPAAPAPLPPLREGSPGRARPLGRTHSAPLPLGDPALAPHALRDHIRRTVLTRAHPPPHPPHEEEPEVMDLTARAAPLARALSSPLVGAGGAGGARPRTGLAYDPVMLKHGCACGARAPAHPEHAGRLQSVWARLAETGLAARAARVRARRASPEELGAVHAAAHVAQWAGRGAVRALARLPCGGLGADADTAWSEAHTPTAARAAAGLVLELATRIASGDLHNGFAAVRPPGHHAEHNQAMGFCFFNSVAMTARLLHTRHNLQRILIVDWDVHHGNGTQQMFYESSNVLYISLHRHDDGNFFPGTGAAAETGAGAGAGHTVNVAWNGSLDPPMGDAEYLAAFRTVVMPIAKEYAPEIVLVSCGFDAAAGHAAPLGGYLVSAACFAAMTRSLLALAGGRVLLALEGGYELRALCDAAAASVRALLGEPVELPAAAELARPPAPAAQRALRAVHAAHQHYWPVLKRYTDLIGVSALEAGAGVCESATPLASGAGGGAGAALVGAGVAGAWRSAQSERDADNTVAAMATLSVHALRSPESSRSVSEEPMEQDDAK